MRFSVYILILWINVGNAQTNYFYDKPSDNQYFTDDIVLLSDQSVTVSGALSSITPLIRKPFLLKLAPNGDVLWEKTYTLDTYADFHRLKRSQYGGFVGLIEQGEYNYCVAKFDSIGDINWIKQFQYDLSPHSFHGADVIECSDGSIVSVGNYNHQGCLFGMTFHVARLTPTGEVMWSKRFADSTFNPGALEVHEIIQRWNGNLLISFGGARLIEMDLTGNILQEVVLDTEVPRDCRMNELPDGSIIISGNSVNRLRLTRIDSQLNMLWSYWYDDSLGYEERVNDIIVNNNTIYFIGKVLSDNTVDQFSNRGFVAEFDFQGNLLSAHMSGRFVKDVYFAADLHANGDLLIGGTSRSPVDNYSDINVARVPSSLVSYCNHLTYSMQRSSSGGTGSIIDFYYLEPVAVITPSVTTTTEANPIRVDCVSTLSVASQEAYSEVVYNVTQKKIEITLPNVASGDQFYLVDEMGRILKTGALKSHTTVSLIGMSEGVYFIRTNSGISERILHY